MAVAIQKIRRGISEAYSSLRRLVQSMDALWREGATPEIRGACGETLKHLHAAEDATILRTPPNVAASAPTASRGVRISGSSARGRDAFNAALKASPVISRKRGPIPKAKEAAS